MKQTKVSKRKPQKQYLKFKYGTAGATLHRADPADMILRQPATVKQIQSLLQQALQEIRWCRYDVAADRIGQAFAYCSILLHQNKKV